MNRKFFLRSLGVAMEADTKVATVTERDVLPQEGDDVYVLMRGRVARVFGERGGEVEVDQLLPVEITKIQRG